jgi:hypothetical protein
LEWQATRFCKAFAHLGRGWNSQNEYTNHTAKLADHGMHCMFVGHALDHARDVYQMWNPKTGWVHKMRDVIWLHRMYFEKPVEQEEIGIMPALDENKMVQAGGARWPK